MGTPSIHGHLAAMGAASKDLLLPWKGLGFGFRSRSSTEGGFRLEQSTGAFLRIEVRGLSGRIFKG